MNARLGRLRWIDLVVFICAAGLLHLLFSQAWFDSGSVAADKGISSLGPAGWLAFVIGVMGILVVPATVLRRSQATAIGLDVGIFTLGLFSVLAAGANLLWPPAVNGLDGTPTTAGLLGSILVLLLWISGTLAFRSESNGISPDPSVSPIELGLTSVGAVAQSAEGIAND
ncbi:MAG: hypothetical protein NTX07_09725 [Solirubrobacterales bacterium]|nr:hypothetical protein [Solirubrobacterales bacterium]